MNANSQIQSFFIEISHVLASEQILVIAVVLIIIICAQTVLALCKNYKLEKQAASKIAEQLLAGIGPQTTPMKETLQGLQTTLGRTFTSISETVAVAEPSPAETANTKQKHEASSGAAITWKLLELAMTTDRAHYVAIKALPVQEFFNENYNNGKVDTEQRFDFLVRFALTFSFAGIAAVLMLSSNALLTSTGGAQPAVKSAAALVPQILGILGAAATKFWVTVAALTFGLIMLVCSRVIESLILNKAYSKMILAIEKTLLSEAFGEIVKNNVSRKAEETAAAVSMGTNAAIAKLVRELAGVSNALAETNSSIDRHSHTAQQRISLMVKACETEFSRMSAEFKRNSDRLVERFEEAAAKQYGVLSESSRRSEKSLESAGRILREIADSIEAVVEGNADQAQRILEEIATKMQNIQSLQLTYQIPDDLKSSLREQLDQFTVAAVDSQESFKSLMAKMTLLSDLIAQTLLKLHKNPAT